MSLQPPSALDSERAVLGGLLLAPKLLPDVAGLVTSEDFYHPAHACIFAAMVSCEAAGSPVDAVSVFAAMTSARVEHRLSALGGEAYFATLTGDAIVDALPWHAQRIRSKADRRRWIETAQAITAAGYGDEEDGEFFESSEAMLSRLAERSHADGYRHIKLVLAETFKAVEARYERQQAVTGVPTGHTDLDEYTGGFQPGQLIVIGGRPKMGKTALAMSTVEHASTGRNCNGARIPCLVFSLEMVGLELGARFVSSAGSIEGMRLRNGLLEQGDWIRFTRASGELSEAPISIFDKPATFSRIRSVARRWRSRDTDTAADALVVVDYIGLIASDAKRDRNSNREQEIAAWSRGFKSLAKELRAPVILLAQLNRSVESRADKRPTMSDLRESGAIEQDADLVLLVYRDEVYNTETSSPGIAEVIIAAGRHTPSGMVPLRFEGAYTRFSDCPPSMVPAKPAPTNGKKGNGKWTTREA